MSQSDFYVPDLGRWCFILQFHMQSKGALERRFKAEKSGQYFDVFCLTISTVFHV